MKSGIIENVNLCSGYNYQLLENNIIDLDNDRMLTSYSILANVIENNRVKKGMYICDVARDIITAEKVFRKISSEETECETLAECIEELLS